MSATALLHLMGSLITAIQPQKRSKHRVNVYVDGAYAFSLSEVVAARLTVGAELTEEIRALISREETIEAARFKAERFLAHRPRSESEVRARLRRDGLDEEVIEAVIANLVKRRLLDDKSFARFWIEQRETFRPRGAAALRQELRQKGVSRDVIEQALADQDDLESARRAARPRAQRLSDLSEEAFGRKLGGFLQRRGFSYSICKQVTSELWAEVEASS